MGPVVLRLFLSRDVKWYVVGLGWVWVLLVPLKGKIIRYQGRNLKNGNGFVSQL